MEKEHGMSKATFTATVRAFASLTNPLQTRLDIVLTDFQPNGNKQCIPFSEAENILESAKDQPLKMNFKDGKENGHDYSYPIGTLSDVYLDGDVIRAKAKVWKTEYAEEDDYLRKATAEGKTLQTSWEIYYSDSEEKDGIQYLRGCKFAATVIVENPAYGGRTPILSIAERIEEREKVEQLERGKAQVVEELEQMKSTLDQVYQWLGSLYMKICEAEEHLPEMMSPEMVGTMLQKMNERLDQMKMEYSELKSKYDTLETAKAELETKLSTIESEKLEAAKAEKLQTRKEKVQSLGVDEDEIDIAFIEDMTDDDFVKYEKSLHAAYKKAKSSTGDSFIPEPIGDSNITISDLAKKLNEREKSK